ncbi:MAG: ATP-binding cassette domain-containing protein [Planctomycetota bacterium]|jgi:ABC-2 type transport system ATP-binding protein
MITVDKLAKSYDGITYALKGISFEVERGEVIGFLGPNGAGKSTTMKILTGFLLPTAGTATVEGLDVVEDSLEVRRRIGYLPETNPLYYEMRVDDYLRFAAEIRGVKKVLVKNAVDRVVDLCGLAQVYGKSIIELSKGYKQRVGLAQAMIHEPDVLILDEPTSGLDPNQIVEIRRLITKLGEHHTVILSTHILQEVEASCSRIMVVSQGELVADGTREELVAEVAAGDIQARIRGPAKSVQRQLAELLGSTPVEEVARNGEYGVYRIRVTDRQDTTIEEGIAHLVVKNDWALAEIGRQQPTLEDFFHQKTLHAQVEAGDA